MGNHNFQAGNIPAISIFNIYMGEKTMMYSYYAKNTGKDEIYKTRLLLIEKHGININKNPKIYSYYVSAYLGIILL